MNGEPVIRGTGPRPLDFVRIRLYRGGQIEYVRELMEGAQDFWFKRLGELRDEGYDEDSEEVEYARSRLHYLVNALKDVTSGMIETAGSGEHR